MLSDQNGVYDVLNLFYKVSRCTILLILILSYMLVDGIYLTSDLCHNLSFLET